MTSEFQLILPLAELDLKHPPPAESLSLGVKCDESKVLSVNYLTEKQERIPPQNEVAAELECQLRVHFKNPSDSDKSAYFRNLPLCVSEIDLRAQENGKPRIAEEYGRALEVVRCIPCGEVRAYGVVGENAKWCNREDVEQMYDWATVPVAVAVGDACFVNPLSVVIPCYRVVTSDNKLSGFRGNKHVQGERENTLIKAWLLECEGCTVDKDDEDPRNWRVTPANQG